MTKLFSSKCLCWVTSPPDVNRQNVASSFHPLLITNWPTLSKCLALSGHPSSSSAENGFTSSTATKMNGYIGHVEPSALFGALSRRDIASRAASGETFL